MRVRSLPLPAWIVVLTTPLFGVTWLLAPGELISGPYTVAESAVPARSHPTAPIMPLERAARVGPWRGQGPETVFGVERSWRVAFTFDDGPHTLHTRRLIDILERHGVTATFFINGYWLDASWRDNSDEALDLVRRAHSLGHTIANHTYSHVRLNRIAPEQQTEEIIKNHRLIHRITGEPPTLFRPPYAQMTNHARQVLRSLGYTEARWSATAPDEQISDPERLANTVMSWLLAYNGGIVMLHDRFRHSVAAVELILKSITRHNCRRHFRRQPTFQVVSLDSFARPPPHLWSPQADSAYRKHVERLQRNCTGSATGAPMVSHHVSTTRPANAP